MASDEWLEALGLHTRGSTTSEREKEISTDKFN